MSSHRILRTFTALGVLASAGLAGSTSPAVADAHHEDAIVTAGGGVLHGVATQLPLRRAAKPKPKTVLRCTGKGKRRRCVRVRVSAPAPAAAPVSTASNTSSHSWIMTSADGRPARWNPCSTIRVGMNLAQAPPSAASDLAQSLAEISASSGLRFAIVGQTGYVPATSSEAGWPADIDLVVAWVSPAEVGELGGSVAGFGGPRRAVMAGSEVKVTRGSLVIDGAQLRSERWAMGLSGGVSHGNVLRHELGHVVGLGHVGDNTQLMAASITGGSPNGFQHGDRAGLGRLGQGGCL